MAGGNVEVVRELVAAVVAGDREGFLSRLTPDVEWDDREGWPGVRRLYHGHAGARQWFDAFMTVGGEILRGEIEDIAEAGGNRVLLSVFGTFRRRTADGAPVEFNARAWYVISLRAGRVSGARLFWTRSQALKVAGLAE